MNRYVRKKRKQKKLSVNIRKNFKKPSKLKQHYKQLLMQKQAKKKLKGYRKLLKKKDMKKKRL